VVNAKGLKVLATSFSEGKMHDFKLFEKSRLPLKNNIPVNVDTGYLGISKWYNNVSMPKKKSKLHPLTKAQKKRNKALASERIFVEHVIGKLKRFKIISDRYRNRRKRFGLRFNLIAGIYNFELDLKANQ
jgi:hypothetical protein